MADAADAIGCHAAHALIDEAMFRLSRG